MPIPWGRPKAHGGKEEGLVGPQRPGLLDFMKFGPHTQTPNTTGRREGPWLSGERKAGEDRNEFSTVGAPVALQVNRNRNVYVRNGSQKQGHPEGGIPPRGPPTGQGRI